MFSKVIIDLLMVDCSPPNACSQCLTSPNTSSSPFLSLPFTYRFSFTRSSCVPSCEHLFISQIEIVTSNPIMLIAATYPDLTSKMTGIYPQNAINASFSFSISAAAYLFWPFLESARDFNSIIIRLHFPSSPSPLFLLLLFCYLTFRQREGNFSRKFFNKISRKKYIKIAHFTWPLL